MRIGIEIGGTFTDLILLRESEEPLTLKVSSTPSDPSEGALNGCRKLLEKANGRWSDIEELLHGSTVATNILIERKGAKSALITTAGFEDILLIGRQEKTRIYDPFYQRSTPLISREHIYGVPERLDREGSVVIPLDEASVVSSVEKAIAAGVNSVAIVFLHSYRNPSHERQAQRLIEERFPDLDISISSDIAPEFREYERTSTTVINSYVRPVVRQYVRKLADSMRGLGYRHDLMIMQSNGGVLPADAASRLPVRMFLSGPAAGVAGAAFVARQCNLANLLTVDVGGTSCDISIVADQKPLMSSKGLTEYRIDGNPINIRMMDITTIGAGGGSIAWLDGGGMLRVGPQSAGAQPGPACYSRGGTEFTLTDALVTLGLIDPARFLGGEMKIDPALSLNASEKLSGQLNMTSRQLALSVFQIAVVNIAQAIRQTTVQRGRDPRDFAILPYGGGGALFAASIAEVMDIEKVVVPPNPGIFSAFGLTASEIRLDYTKSDPGRRLSELTIEKIEAEFSELRRTAESEFSTFGISGSKIGYTHLVDARYVGQGFELTIHVDPACLRQQGLQTIAHGFHEAHAARYGHAFSEQSVELVSYRLEANVPRAGVLPARPSARQQPAGMPKTVCLQGEEQWQTYERRDLPIGSTLDGPAIIFEPTSATAVPSQWKVNVDDYGNLHLSRKKGG
ncbi:MAG: hydantoinase/oxoprolinase family protein [Lautropia sp.]